MCASGSGGSGRYRLRLLEGGWGGGEMGSYSVGELHCNLTFDCLRAGHSFKILNMSADTSFGT